MSIDTHSPSVAGFRCEQITIDTVALPCVRSRLAPSFDPSDASDRDDPAVLIGLALAFIRQGPLLDGLVPEPVMLRLRALTDGGNAACHLLLDWLQNRNRDFDRHRVLPVMSADRHSPRERVLAKIAKPGPIDRRRRGRTWPRDPVQSTKTAIIAAETGGRADG
ncbi:hypothetical protein GGE16_005369 [Rhizobium leguminosarum]|uniref:Uncharacterized protein n=1 Tax=Rhizobium leguminosarum TaxID=384 RepID=A0AAE2MPT1_RHILE|nr:MULTISPECIES: hypothetical protein [Rhizobium]MBB4293282.1 hypothetical protein [Rhizobium leguminosarum]MBB4296109.1 hypothetical protein [Rhizobium leguminosarum]MBB4311456.1 hypothetical protein [Rhizobium leguminosarum]MBB4420338.1 hypothetical protein [Rhizobium leguminosarum]MBB4435507.1 hypothetical protein [Rhizobium esperanzae]